ncbi:MAG TPA: gfo/Idh/MocA family oxidoreductase [Prolixibacteraceae bacterium]|nr:gfo/Idh/MocA family oxidoreductase [Prolixibacteraceae bacterium]
MTNELNRRNFIKGAAAISAFTILKPMTVFGTRANSAIRMGIIGTGGRGLSVIGTMSANNNIHIAAAADLFEDKLTAGVMELNSMNQKKGFPEISISNLFVGSNAYLQLLGSKDIDAVLISSPAYTHPEFLEAAVEANKHIYCEKPASVDVAGCKRVEKAGVRADGKLSIVIGFQIRYASPYVEMVKRIQEGAIGELMNAQLYYLSSGSAFKPFPNVVEDELRIRNQYKFTALSGGILLDQGIHMIDVCNWALQSSPVSARGFGGRKGAISYGDTWSNFEVAYQYPGDINVSLHCSQVGTTFGDVCARFVGTKGIAEAHYSGGVFIEGVNAWDSGILRNTQTVLSPDLIAKGATGQALFDSDKNKGQSFIQSIESGNYLNQTIQASTSTLSAILGRYSAIHNEQTTMEDVRFTDEHLDAGINWGQFDK